MWLCGFDSFCKFSNLDFCNSYVFLSDFLVEAYTYLAIVRERPQCSTIWLFTLAIWQGLQSALSQKLMGCHLCSILYWLSENTFAKGCSFSCICLSHPVCGYPIYPLSSVTLNPGVHGCSQAACKLSQHGRLTQLRVSFARSVRHATRVCPSFGKPQYIILLI